MDCHINGVKGVYWGIATSNLSSEFFPHIQFLMLRSNFNFSEKPSLLSVITNDIFLLQNIVLLFTFTTYMALVSPRISCIYLVIIASLYILSILQL